MVHAVPRAVGTVTWSWVKQLIAKGANVKISLAEGQGAIHAAVQSRGGGGAPAEDLAVGAGDRGGGGGPPAAVAVLPVAVAALLLAAVAVLPVARLPACSPRCRRHTAAAPAPGRRRRRCPSQPQAS